MANLKPGTSLQELFIESKGAPVVLGDCSVIQMDRIPIKSGIVSVEFQGEPVGRYGVALKSAKGGIVLSDGRTAPLVHVWDEPDRPRKALHRIDCPDGELRVWNVYRTKHHNGEVTEDAWTGNAGMVVDYQGPNIRSYRCSSGLGAFNPDEFAFLLRWENG